MITIEESGRSTLQQIMHTYMGRYFVVRLGAGKMAAIVGVNNQSMPNTGVVGIATQYRVPMYKAAMNMQMGRPCNLNDTRIHSMRYMKVDESVLSPALQLTIYRVVAM